MKKGQEWTDEQLLYLREHYPSERAEDVGKAIGRTAGSVMHMAHQCGIYKDKEALSRIMSISNSGANSGNFKGYRTKTKEGYVRCYRPEHPYANSRGYINEHRLVMEEHLGVILTKEFAVHHINGIKDDNRIENLAVMTVGAHSALHGRMGRNVPCGERNKKYKSINAKELKMMREEGQTVDQICKKMNICKFTFYKKIKEGA